MCFPRCFSHLICRCCHGWPFTVQDTAHFCHQMRKLPKSVLNLKCHSSILLVARFDKRCRDDNTAVQLHNYFQLNKWVWEHQFPWVCFNLKICFQQLKGHDWMAVFVLMIGWWQVNWSTFHFHEGRVQRICCPDAIDRVWDTSACWQDRAAAMFYQSYTKSM